MRRLLTALLTCGVVAAGLSVVAEPAPAEAVPAGGLSVGEGWALPPVPEGQALGTISLVGDRVWAVLVAAVDGEEQRTLWSAPSDGSGSWTQYPGLAPVDRTRVQDISSAGGAALTVSLGHGARAMVIHPGGEREVSNGSEPRVAPGGRLVYDYDFGVERITTPAGDVVPVDLPTRDVQVAGSRISWIDGDTYRSRDILDGGPDIARPLVVSPCSTYHQVRGRWALPTCATVETLIDLEGALGPKTFGHALRPPHWQIGHDFLLRWRTDDAPAAVVDPITLEELDLPGWTTVRPDAGDHARVLVQSAAGEHRVLPILGLTEEPAPDETAPIVTLDPLPRTISRRGLDSDGRTPFSFGWSSADVDLSAVEYHVDGFETIKTHPAVTSASGLADNALRWPCVLVRGTDRAGNVGPWDMHCFTWDGDAPIYFHQEPILEPLRAGAAVIPVSFRGRFEDDSSVVLREHRVRRADRSGRFTPWSVARRSSGDWLRTSIRPGHRVCVQGRATDGLGIRAGWASLGCVTAPYDDASLRRVGPVAPVRSSGALGDRAVRVGPGGRLITPTTMTGREAMVRILKGPGQGRAELMIGGKVTWHVKAYATKRHWAWVSAGNGRIRTGRIEIRPYQGSVTVDALGTRGYGDIESLSVR